MRVVQFVKTLLRLLKQSVQRSVSPSSEELEDSAGLPPIRYIGDPTEIYLA